MEMIRTVIVAMFFAAITVCSYYFLSSSPFPWENNATIATTEGRATDITATATANTFESPALETPEYSPSTVATNDGPFMPAPHSDDSGNDFALPELDELPPAQISEPSNVANTETFDTTTDLSVPPETELYVTVPTVQDTDLPSLNNASVNSPFDTVPPAISAETELRVGSEMSMTDNSVVSETIDPKHDATNDYELPPPPELSVELPMPTAMNTEESSVKNTTANTVTGNTVSNPLRSGNITDPANDLRSVNTNNVGISLTTPNVSSKENSETEEIREYLKIATEKINQGKALEVLQALSKYYGDPRFSTEELAELTNILVQAATLVIYSQQSYIVPAYTVQAGDSVEKIAQLYQIPEEFIIRVNGLTAPFELQPGTQLKVVKGPFHAIVYLDRHEMLLTLNGVLFAGRFWIGVGGELIQKDGDFMFGQKVTEAQGMQDVPYYEFLRVAGVAGCSDAIHIQPATDSNCIGGNAPTGALLMSLTDIDSLGALLGAHSKLIMRCTAPKVVNIPKTNVATDSALSAPITTPAEVQAEIPTIAPAVGMQAPVNTSDVPTSTSSYDLPTTLDEIPAMLPTDGGNVQSLELPTSL